MHFTHRANIEVAGPVHFPREGPGVNVLSASQLRHLLAAGGIIDVRWLSDSEMCFYEPGWRFPHRLQDRHDGSSHNKES